jgi:hypothetical protein
MESLVGNYKVEVDMESLVSKSINEISSFPIFEEESFAVAEPNFKTIITPRNDDNKTATNHSWCLGRKTYGVLAKEGCVYIDKLFGGKIFPG